MVAGQQADCVPLRRRQARAARTLCSARGKPGRPGAQAHQPDGIPRHAPLVAGWREIAILFTENAPRAAGPLEPSTKDAGVVEEHIYEQRLTLVERALRRSEADHSGRYLRLRVRLGAGQRPHCLHRVERQRRQQLVDCAALHDLGGVRRGPSGHKPELQIANPRWSPDGKQIAFIGGIMSDEGSDWRRYLCRARDGRRRTSQPDTGPQELAELAALASFRKDSFHRRRSTAAPPLPRSIVPSRVVETLWTGDESLRAGDDALSTSSDGRTLAAIAQFLDARA